MSGKKNLLQKAATPFTIPMRIIANKGLRKDLGMYHDALNASDKSLICPTCNQGRIYTLYQSEEATRWGCSHCGFQTQTQTPNLKELKELVELHGQDWHAQGQQTGLNTLEDEEKRLGVKRLVFYSRVFLGLTFLSFLLFLFFLKVEAGLSSFNMALVTLYLALHSLHASYHAWKLHNNLLYHRHPKNLFLHWLKQGRVGCYPTNYQTPQTKEGYNG